MRAFLLSLLSGVGEARDVTSAFHRAILLTGIVFVTPLATVAAGPFSRQLTSEEYASAGLAKLSAAERAQLDILIGKHETGELARARSNAAAAEAARIAAEKREESATARAAATVAAAAAAAPTGASPPAKTDGSRLKKIKPKPGTAIEYETVETEIVGGFSGWRPGTIFALANGQRWRVSEGSYPSPRETAHKRAKIVSGMLGNFFLEIEGVRSRPKVEFAGNVE